MEEGYEAYLFILFVQEIFEEKSEYYRFSMEMGPFFSLSWLLFCRPEFPPEVQQVRLNWIYECVG